VRRPLAEEGNLRVKSTMLSDDRRLLSHLADLEPEKRAWVLEKLGEDAALRDVGADLTLDRIRDVLEYAPSTTLARQIRAALAHILRFTDPDANVSCPQADQRGDR
jgi:hypothetical protein